MVLALAAVVAVTGVHATLTRAIPTAKSGGDRVVVAWTLRDRAGHPYVAKHVYVKIICPTRTDYTTTFAASSVDGRYRVTAVVPPGGIGRIVIGARNVTFPITNDPFRHS